MAAILNALQIQVLHSVHLIIYNDFFLLQLQHAYCMKGQDIGPIHNKHTIMMSPSVATNNQYVFKYYMAVRTSNS